MTGGVPQLRASGFAKPRAELLLRASLEAPLRDESCVATSAEIV
jgi:hypothetical protein